MLRQVRGIGTLVPETVVVIAASDAGRIERRRVQPGQSVAPGTVLLELGSPQVEQEYLDAEAQLREAEADLANLRAQLEDQRLTQESVTADVEGQYLQAKAQYEADLVLSKEGLTDQVTLMKSRVSMEHLRKQFQLERAREDARKPSVEAQLATKLRALYQRRKGRDLFDLATGLADERIDAERIVAGFCAHMERAGDPLTRAMFEWNLAGKLGDAQFNADMSALLRTGFEWRPTEAARTVSERLIALLPGEPWKRRLGCGPA